MLDSKTRGGGGGAASVEELATPLGAAVTRQLAAGVLHRELVVIGELLTGVDAARGEDDNVLLAVHRDDARVAVGLAGVVDEACRVTVHRGVHHLVVVDAEHVTADTLEGETEKHKTGCWIRLFSHYLADAFKTHRVRISVHIL